MKSTVKYSTDELLKYIHMYINGRPYRELVEDHRLTYIPKPLERMFKSISITASKGQLSNRQ
ncbi:hypothetical protein [Salinicoccus sp. HZC-1]|uniref:hypothetical protein n=1 Tax=Salinicoccus sp. HZC-1 TaxID=3385497 RepID=UPI00398AB652